jgi:hypothetical protein
MFSSSLFGFGRGGGYHLVNALVLLSGKKVAEGFGGVQRDGQKYEALEGDFAGVLEAAEAGEGDAGFGGQGFLGEVELEPVLADSLGQF